MATISAALALALAHQQAGRLELAEDICRRVLAVEPDQPDALHRLGMIAHRQGRHDLALDYVAAAIRRRETDATFHASLGMLLKERGELDAAIAAYQQALRLRPDYAEMHYNLGNAWRDLGRLDEAAAAYRRAAYHAPGFAPAYNNLGVVLRDLGQLDEAIGAYQHALHLDPACAETYINLGLALRSSGRLPEAAAAVRAALRRGPDSAVAHNNLGLILQALGELDDAVAAYQRAVDCQPDFAEAYNNLGTALNELGRQAEAVAACQRALQFLPDCAEAHYNLANAWKDQGNLAAAAAAYQRAIQCRPDYAPAHANLGVVLRNQGRPDAALAALRQALQCDPFSAGVCNNLAIVLRDLNRLNDARAAALEALRLDPAYAEAHNTLGLVLQGQGQLDDAVAAYQRSICLRPDYAQVHSNLGTAYKDQGLLPEARAEYRAALRLKPDYAEAHSNVLYTMYFQPECDAQVIHAAHRQWNAEQAEALTRAAPPHSNERSAERRLRVGYVSADFRWHPVGRFVLPLLAAHDRTQVEVYGYSTVRSPDGLTERCRLSTDVWRAVAGLTDAQLAAAIRADALDVLVDLSLHTAENRLLTFARKPAPVQATYLAYCGTSGLRAMDYRLSDACLDPPEGDASIYTEETLRLPATYWCYAADAAMPACNALPAAARGPLSFGCLNNFCKASAPALAAWRRILQAVPNSRLVLHAYSGSHRDRVRQYFAEGGIAGERLTFVGGLPPRPYFEVYQQIDVALDPFPYGGGTTTCDALWMGVPVVSLVGRTAVGRGGLSILSNVGLPELAVGDVDSYVRLAVALANDLPRLRQLRGTLRERMRSSPLMDAVRFARHIESAYRQMWRRWCAG